MKIEIDTTGILKELKPYTKIVVFAGLVGVTIQCFVWSLWGFAAAGVATVIGFVVKLTNDYDSRH